MILDNFEHFRDLGAKNNGAKQVTQFQVRKQSFSKKHFMKNRYLLIFGAKTTGANHRTFQFLRFRKVHQERAFTTEFLESKSLSGESLVTMYFCCGPCGV